MELFRLRYSRINYNFPIILFGHTNTARRNFDYFASIDWLCFKIRFVKFKYWAIPLVNSVGSENINLKFRHVAEMSSCVVWVTVAFQSVRSVSETLPSKFGSNFGSSVFKHRKSETFQWSAFKRCTFFVSLNHAVLGGDERWRYSSVDGGFDVIVMMRR